MVFRLLDLFSGIGGFSLGLERTGGFRTVAFCEIEPFCRAVLKKHWPAVPCYPDVKILTADALARDGIAVDVICGGFPCQDISVAGKGAGITGERSGLWSEYARIIGEIRPRYVIVENVAALLNRGLSRVLGDLAALGYDAEWNCIPASAVGAPHRRDRLWIVAHPERGGLQAGGAKGNGDDGSLCGGREHPGYVQAIADAGRDMADAPIDGRRSGRPWRSYPEGAWELESALCDANGARLEVWEGVGRDTLQECAAAVGANWWSVEPDIRRVAHGVPARVDRLRSLGNAVVPQIPEMIGRAILAADCSGNAQSLVAVT